MNEFGSAFRKLRKNKKMTLIETSHNIVAHSTLAAFERNEHLLGFDCLLKLLCRLNISFQEFCNYINLPQPEYQNFINQVYAATVNKDFIFLEDLLSKLKKKKKISDSLIDRCNYIMIKSILDQMRETKTLTKEEILYISEYLWNCEVFGHYELTLYGNTLYSLTTESILVITTELFSSIQEMDVKRLNTRDYIRSAQNSILELISRKEYKSAKKISYTLEKNIPQTFFLEKFTNKFYWNIIMLNSTRDSIYKNHCNKQLEFLKETLNSELYEYYEDIKNKFEDFIEI